MRVAQVQLACAGAGPINMRVAQVQLTGVCAVPINMRVPTDMRKSINMCLLICAGQIDMGMRRSRMHTTGATSYPVPSSRSSLHARMALETRLLAKMAASKLICVLLRVGLSSACAYSCLALITSDDDGRALRKENEMLKAT